MEIEIVVIERGVWAFDHEVGIGYLLHEIELGNFGAAYGEAIPGRVI